MILQGAGLKNSSRSQTAGDLQDRPNPG